MARHASRLLAFLALILFIFLVHWLAGRIQYERLLNRLYITFDDFDQPFAETLARLPDSHGNNDELRAYNYSSYTAPDVGQHIPSTIHFIFFPDLYETHEDTSDIPSMGSHAPKECQHWNSDYQINVWNATASRALLKEHYEWFLPTYDNYAHPIQRVDAIKYFILYHFGGFYLDLDITCRRQLKPIQRFPAWFPRASPQGVNNDAMATRAQHPVFKKMIDSLESRDRSLIFPYLTVFWSTGPQFVTDLVKQYLDENKQLRNYVAGSSKEDADSDAIYVLPQKFYSEQYSFFGHSPGGTWHEGDVAVVLWFVDRPWAVLGLFALVAWLFAAVVLLRLRSRRSWRISGRNSRSQYTDLTQDDESVSLDDLEALSDVSSRS